MIIIIIMFITSIALFTFRYERLLQHSGCQTLTFHAETTLFNYPGKECTTYTDTAWCFVTIILRFILADGILKT